MPWSRCSSQRLSHRPWRACAAALCVAALIGLAGGAFSAKAQNAGIGLPPGSPYPPWQGGANNDALERGAEFTVPEADDLADFHGDPVNAQLVLYVGGNAFFTMAPLVAAFEAHWPELKGHLFWETLPPGFLLQQLHQGGRVTVGNMSFTAVPDVYLAGLKTVEQQVANGSLTGPVVSYATNRLTIMVAAGNPQHITGLNDLTRPDLKLAMPNGAFEDVAQQIQVALKKTGGSELVRAVYDLGVKQGSVRLTQIHHRQTPLWIMQGVVDAGVTWQSEALFQEQIGHAIGHVEIPAAQNVLATYAGALVQGAPHAGAAERWLAFIQSQEALAILARYGFTPAAAP